MEAYIGPLRLSGLTRWRERINMNAQVVDGCADRFPAPAGAVRRKNAALAPPERCFNSTTAVTISRSWLNWRRPPAGCHVRGGTEDQPRPSVFAGHRGPGRPGTVATTTQPGPREAGRSSWTVNPRSRLGRSGVAGAEALGRRPGGGGTALRQDCPIRAAGAIGRPFVLFRALIPPSDLSGLARWSDANG